LGASWRFARKTQAGRSRSGLVASLTGATIF